MAKFNCPSRVLNVDNLRIGLELVPSKQAAQSVKRKAKQVYEEQRDIVTND